MSLWGSKKKKSARSDPSSDQVPHTGSSRRGSLGTDLNPIDGRNRIPNKHERQPEYDRLAEEDYDDDFDEDFNLRGVPVSQSRKGSSKRGISPPDRNRSPASPAHAEPPLDPMTEAVNAQKRETMFRKHKHMSTTWPSGKKKTFWPLIEELVDKGQLVPDSRLKCCMDMLVTLLTLLVFVVGFGCLFAYSVGVNQRSQMNFLDTSFPVLLHITGVGTSVLLKVYYDLSPTVGHLESMSLIIRSRMWLFPGILGNLKVRMRSDEDKRTKKENALGKQRQEAIRSPRRGSSLKIQGDQQADRRFNMLRFLKRCRFPEFRVLYRAFDVYPWNKVTGLKDVHKQDMLMEIARHQIEGAFPVLDLLSVCSSLPSACNPVNYLRLAKRLAISCTCRQRQVMAPVQFPQYVTRAEDIEEDDVSQDPLCPFYERKEPLPWGTLRLNDCPDRFKTMSYNVNLMALLTFGLCLGSYMTMLVGELDFYARIAAVYEEHGGPYSEGLEDYLFSLGLNASGTSAVHTYSEEELDGWIKEYGALHAWSGTAIILIVCMFPFGIQASALLAENVVYPLLVLGTLTTHIDNFSHELDQYLTVLAINHGSLAHHRTHNFGVDESSRVYESKVAVTRDIALSWRMGRFFNEVTNDAKTINTSVAVMVLNFVCHLIPLNNFLLNTDSQCVPIWMILFSSMQVVSLGYIISAGLTCNDMIDGGIDSLLHEWQLKFLMIGWSGGFLAEATDDEKQLDAKEVVHTRDSDLVDHDEDAEVGGKKEEEEDENEEEMKFGDLEFVAYVAKNPNKSFEHSGSFLGGTEETGDLQQDGVNEILQNMVVNRRIDSVIRVLAHYEAESITPLSVLGVTLTHDMITLIVGFFGGSILSIATSVFDESGKVDNALMCHGFL